MEEAHFTAQDRKTLTLVEQKVSDLKEALDKIASRFAETSYVESLEKRVDELEANQTWLVRLIIGALITGVVGVYFIVKK